MAVNETIKNGFYRVYDPLNAIWRRIALWTKGEQVECADGNTVEEKIGAINGITDSLASNASDIAASAAAVNTLNQNLDELNKKLLYSLDEIAVSTWIDGKTVYRKCFSGTFSNDGIILTGVDTLIKVYGSALLASKIRMLPFYQIYGGHEFYVTFQQEDNNVKILALDTGAGANVNADFVLEYTKK